MQFTEEHLSLMKTVRDFASNEICPFIEEWESSGGFPAHDLFKKLGSIDMLGITKNTKYGGCLLYTSPSPRDKRQSRMPSSA